MTTHQILRLLFELPWVVFVLYWLVTALKTRPSERSESFLSRYGVMLIVVAGFVLMLDRDARIGVLGRRFLPRSFATTITGIVLEWAGVALALWARYHLGQNWSGRVTIKQGHELIRTGPYAHLRHPIYSGLLLALVGASLQTAQWRELLGIALVLIGFTLKARREEGMLRAQFGASFQEHCEHTGFLLPRFR